MGITEDLADLHENKGMALLSLIGTIFICLILPVILLFVILN